MIFVQDTNMNDKKIGELLERPDHGSVWTAGSNRNQVRKTSVTQFSDSEPIFFIGPKNNSCWARIRTPDL